MRIAGLVVVLAAACGPKATTSLRMVVDVTHPFEVGVDAAQALAQTEDAVRRRLRELGVTGEVTREGDALVVQARGASPAIARLAPLLGRPGRFDIKVSEEDSAFMREVAQAGAPAGVTVQDDSWRDRTGTKRHQDKFLGGPVAALDAAIATLAPKLPPHHELLVEPSGAFDADGRRARSHYVLAGSELSNRDIANATAGTDAQTSQPHVFIRLTQQGKERWARTSARLVGQKIVLVLDGRVTSAPVLIEPITGGTLWMLLDAPLDMLEAEVQDVALLLRAGAYAAPVKLVGAK